MSIIALCCSLMSDLRCRSNLIRRFTSSPYFSTIYVKIYKNGHGKFYFVVHCVRMHCIPCCGSGREVCMNMSQENNNACKTGSIVSRMRIIISSTFASFTWLTTFSLWLLCAFRVDCIQTCDNTSFIAVTVT